MNTFWSKIASGFKWIGKELGLVAGWVPKVFTLVDDVEGDAATVLPELSQLIDDGGALVTAAVKDSGADLAAAESLVAAITTAATKDGLDIASDEAVVIAFQAFIGVVTKTSNYSDVITALGTFVKQYDKLGASASAALKQLETAAVA